jgi:uncharacterized protein (TIGR02594 family)
MTLELDRKEPDWISDAGRKEISMPYSWMDIARKKLGIHEIPGPEANAFIVECLESTTIGQPENQSDETSWCSAFVNRIIQLAGFKGTNSAWARSWLNWGRPPERDDEWEGCVVILERGPNFGHVGFLNDWNGEMVQLLAGNQGDAVSLAWFPMERVLGYRVPA